MYISISCMRGVYIITGAVHLAFFFVLHIKKLSFFIYWVGAVVGR